MYGSSLGYSSSTLERIARWALDFTFDFAPAEMLSELAVWQCVVLEKTVLFLEHFGGDVLRYGSSA